MRERIECWTAERLLPLAGDGGLPPDARAWLDAHRARCRRHEAAPFPAAPFCDEALRDAALARIARSFDAYEERGASGWLGELLLECRAAPVPMAAVSLLALFAAFSPLLSGSFGAR